MTTSSTHALRRILAFEVLSLQSSIPASYVLFGALGGARARVCTQARMYGLAVERALGKRDGGGWGDVRVEARGELGRSWGRSWSRSWGGSLGRSVGRTVRTDAQTAPRSDPTTDGGSDPTTASLTLTPAAVEKIKELQRRRDNPNVGLRLLVSGGGCSGFQYEFEISDGEDEEAVVVADLDGAKLYCDDMSMSFVKGSTIDYENDMIQSKFVVSENPNAELGCGCGSSFSVAM